MLRATCRQGKRIALAEQFCCTMTRMVWPVVLLAMSQQEAFNDRVIELLFLSRAGKLFAESEDSLRAEGFDNVRISPFNLSLNAKPIFPISYDNLVVSEPKAQEAFVTNILGKLKRRLPNSTVIMGTPLKSQGKAVGQEIYLYRQIDGIRCTHDNLKVIVDFRLGRIQMASTTALPDEVFVSQGPHISDSEVDQILQRNKVYGYTVSQVWMPYNFVMSGQASDAHATHYAVMTLVRYMEKGQQRFSMINDLGEFVRSPDYTSWLVDLAMKRRRTNGLIPGGVQIESALVGSGRQ